MLARSIALVIVLAAQLRAVDTDFRAGLWEGTIERGRGVERIVLLLTISVAARNGPNAAISAVARIESGTGICGANKVEVEPNRVSFECTTISKRDEAEPVAGRFEGYFSLRSNLVTGTWRAEPLQLTRPSQSNSLTTEGDWVAESADETCVVRFFDRGGSRLMSSGAATIDIYSKDRAVFGKQLNYSARRGREDGVAFGWEDTDKNMFGGKFGADNSELTGLWQGHDFLCATPQPVHKITFRLTRSSL